MKRQHKDGSPIPSDSVWQTMQETGNKLEYLGYIESVNKPNLFYKTTESLTDNEENGLIFVDVRGTSDTPISEDCRPITYYRNLSFKEYITDLIILKRAGCIPRLTFYTKYEPNGWAFSLEDIPDGHCKECGKDILSAVNWSVLEDGLFNELIELESIDPIIEINYCGACKKSKYEKEPNEQFELILQKLKINREESIKRKLEEKWYRTLIDYAQDFNIPNTVFKDILRMFRLLKINDIPFLNKKASKEFLAAAIYSAFQANKMPKNVEEIEKITTVPNDAILQKYGTIEQLRKENEERI